MSFNDPFARRLRLRRLHRHDSERLLIVPLDHSISDGPITAGRALDGLVCELSVNGVDAVVLHKGSLRNVDPERFNRTSLIVHLSASTRHAPDPNAKYLVASVDECLRLGADAVSVHVNVGSVEEGRQIADMATVAEACDRWNLPLLAMMYPRGPKITNPKDPGMVAHAASLAVDLGADIVKTMYVGSVAEMADVVRGCPIPIVAVGGPLADNCAEVLAYVDEVMSSGVAGLAVGRNVFHAPDPGSIARRIAGRVHRELEPAFLAEAAETGPVSTRRVAAARRDLAQPR
ncbi:2-amino-3,7-dideoxy-D-threo-hept-6-ulosonate synthase [Amycolatopsis nigrescens]|uniref:2-amino-3,7-dideoxy-D-threo-hept-6-ulosonate synthase n=1 Tax=Amycolatopsis nigrescens TaxID=381445 RepID=UPI0003713934|nr:2-amino-3,7-dideoxy-D-threo-hept-6-ulosonate synthase [Amycolatopsis nigrescens]